MHTQDHTLTREIDSVQAPSCPARVDHELLSPGAARDAALASHPLTLDEQILQTPAIHEAYGCLKRALRFRMWGLSFFCAPRKGKTWAIDALVGMLSIEFPGVPVFVTEALQHDDPTEKGLWTDILSGLGHLSGSTAQAQRATLIDLISSSASLANDAKFVVIAVDEAQNWGPRQWRFIKGLVNTLRNRPYRIRTLVLSFGQSELLKVRDSISRIDDRGEDLIARFLRNMHEFKGITSCHDLEQVLTQFDDPDYTEFPEESGVCYTQFFLPLAYAAGWKLASQSKLLWRQLKLVGKGASEPKMLHIMDAVREFLATATDSETFKPTAAHWKQVIAETSFGKDGS
jgi:hypothetical protein